MAHEARNNICKAAIRLFNEQGYDSVSLRQIAAEAGTTIGNLTYHFAKKEDLLQAILTDLHAGFSDQLETNLHGANLLEHIVSLVCTNEANHRAYPFYFENIAQILRQSPTLCSESNLFASKLYEYYEGAFRTLWSDGWIRQDLHHDALDALAYSIVQMESGWVTANAPFSNDLLPSIRVSVAVCQLLSAYISPEHLDEYRSLCQKQGILE